MARQFARLALLGLLLIPGAASGQDWRDRVGERFELTANAWLDQATLASDSGFEESACRQADFDRSFEVVRSFFRDPKSFSDDLLMNTKSKESCDCARWIVSKQRADWRDVLDYAGLPRCGPESERRECLANGAAPRACAEGEDPFPYQREVIGR